MARVHDNKNGAGGGAFVVLLAFIIALGYGWVMNILWLIKQPLSNITGEFVVSSIGIFVAPLGALMGYIH